ncbi:protein YgfX [Noviherbaspirillum sp.]|uniref:protein YgfX n=1 Tax=Noviherbaspirillum sp. TaxID=1926288 RepID=UPI003FA579A8
MIIACLLLSSRIGDPPPALRYTLGVFIFFLAFFGFYHTVRNRKVLQLNISGTGQVRLSKVTGSTPSCHEQNWPHVKDQGPQVSLLQDSTLWSHLLLLRLKSDDGTTTVIPVLPDSVSRDGFRALSVACRWIAVQQNSSSLK